MKKLLCCAALVFSIVFAFAQPYYFKHYSTDDGLTGNNLVCAVQDSKGFIWLGTGNGLNRFDGYNFKVYRNVPNEKGSIGNSSITSLFRAVNDKLWVGTANGLYQFNESNESFTRARGEADGDITAIAEGAGGAIWFISGGRLCRYQPSAQTFKYYSRIKSEYWAISSTPSGTVWAADYRGNLLRYNSKTDGFEKQADCGKSTPTLTNGIVKLLPIDKDHIVVATRGEGAKIYDVSTHQMNPLPLNNGGQGEILIKDMLLNQGDLWLASESGIYIYNFKTGKTVNIVKDTQNPYSLSDNFVQVIIKDRESSVWAGTAFGGLNCYSARYSFFEKYFVPNRAFSLTGNVLNNIIEDQSGDIYISSADAGVCKFNPQTRSFKSIYFAETPAQTPSNLPYILLAGNELWIGSYEFGLYVTDTRTGKLLKHYIKSKGSHGLNSNFIVCLYQAKNKELFIGTAEGLYSYDRSTDTFKCVFKDYIRTITEDNTGKIWFGTLHNGAIRYDRQANQMYAYQYTKGDNTSLPSNTVNAIFQDRQNRIWFGTEEGICQLEKDQVHVKRNQMPIESALCILQDNNGFFWISTKKGLVRWNPESKQPLQYFTTAYGLPSNQFNYASALKDKHGRMYFGTLKGLISFDPSTFTVDTYHPPVYITSFKINNEEPKITAADTALHRSIVTSKQLVLRHYQSTLSFNFAALTFVAPKTMQYAYKLVGADDNWIDLSVNRTVYYTNLNPGTYKLLVKATNSSGMWTDTPTQLEIIVNAPWWAGSIAYAIYFVIVALIIYLLVKNYHRRAQDKVNLKLKQFENEKEREIYQAKIEFFTHITHEIKTPLTLIRGPLESAMKQTDKQAPVYADLKLMDKNTQRLLNLTGQLLDFRKVESKTISLNFTRIDVAAMLNEIRADFESLIRSRNHKVVMDVPASFYAEADADALRKIIDNLFTNAIKYGHQHILVRLYADDKTFTIEAQNDGELIPDELREKIFEPFFRIDESQRQSGNGIGLALCRSLAGLHSGTLKVVDGKPHLNTFLLTLPIVQPNSFINDAEVRPVATESITDLQTKGKPTILVVDDNVEIAEFLMRTLSCDYAIEIAHNGQEALQKMQKENIHLVVSDVMMPVMNGFELCHSIKTNIDYSHIPVILLTAKSTLESKIEGLGSGADVYIEKPFSPEYLLAQIKSLMKNRDMVKTYFANSPLVHIKDIAYSKSDEEFVEKLNNLILTNIADTDLDVDYLAQGMNMSRTTLYRKIKAISNLSPNELITVARLKKAAEILATDDHKIYEVAFMVGFNSQNYFGDRFLKQFAMTPSAYAQIKRAEKTGVNSRKLN